MTRTRAQLMNSARADARHELTEFVVTPDEFEILEQELVLDEPHLDPITHKPAPYSLQGLVLVIQTNPLLEYEQQ